MRALIVIPDPFPGRGIDCFSWPQEVSNLLRAIPHLINSDSWTVTWNSVDEIYL